MSTLKTMAQKVVLSSGLENFQSDLISENMGKCANQWSGGSVAFVCHGAEVEARKNWIRKQKLQKVREILDDWWQVRDKILNKFRDYYSSLLATFWGHFGGKFAPSPVYFFPDWWKMMKRVL